MNEDSENKKAIERYETLARQRRQIMELSSEKALTAILDAPQPAALVHSFPEEDFYFLINDIGLEDSHELMRLASNRQWEYILDIEVWEKDRIEIRAVTRWFDLLLKVDPQRFIKWFLDEKTEFVEFYLFKNIEVRARKNDQDPSEFDEGFFTFDDTIYVRFKEDVFDPDAEEHEAEPTTREHRDAFLSNFFRVLADYDHVIYQKVLLESASVIPAETEEEAYRLRNVRLAEKGFMPFDEAIGIYQPLKPRDFEKQSVKYTGKDDERRQLLPVPLYHAGMLKEDNLFAGALKRIEINEVLEQIQTEFAGLCNQIVAADQEAVRDREALSAIVKKACGYLNIGLERLTAKGTPLDINRATALIRQYPLAGIFRVGYGRALDLKWRAERWRQTSWFGKEGLLLNFWDQGGMGVLGGLFIKKPLFYDNYATGVLYREFISTDDVEKTEKVLNEIINIDELLALMAVKPESISDALLTYKNLILTLWARNYLGLSKKPVPLTLDEFKRFFDDLWSGEGKPCKTSLKMKEAFLHWLSDRTGQTPHEISQKLGQTLENLFNEIESELGEVSGKDLVPEYIHLFLIEA
ncbi:MAG: DUF6178 family protein [Candidatus Desulfatibia sp.]|uniref:DUF6178 family protein n=1 Tax=Candidatus Desulfatibia sp. TaxID=3101189 RepID=UPI002F2CD4A7